MRVVPQSSCKSIVSDFTSIIISESATVIIQVSALAGTGQLGLNPPVDVHNIM